METTQKTNDVIDSQGNGETTDRPGEEKGERLCIIVCDNRGLTFVGYANPESNPASDVITIKKARCVIAWGTEHHLAQLTNGPRPKTVLGKKADVNVMKKNIVFFYDDVVGDWDV